MLYILSIIKVNDSCYQMTDREYKSIAEEYNIHEARINKFKHEGGKFQM